jgi:hypothetical protein
MEENSTNSNHNQPLEILKAAIPYVNSRARNSMQFIVQAEELTNSLKKMDNSSQLSACSLDEEPPIDMEALLLHIREVCPSAEQEMIDMMLNFMKTQKLYQAYRMFMTTNSFGSGGKTNGFNPFGFGNTNHFMDFIMTQLTPEQKTSFETVRMMMSTMQSQ